MLKIKDYFKKGLVVLIFSLLLAFPDAYLRAGVIVIDWPTDGAQDVSVGCTIPPEAGGDPAWDKPGDADTVGEGQECYFRWQHMAGAVKYVLDIDMVTQSEDNITPDTVKDCFSPETACSGDECVCSGSWCEFPFACLTIADIDFFTFYKWRITAYNDSGDAIHASNEVGFMTEMNPEGPPPPPSENDEPKNDSKNGLGLSGLLTNPLKAETLQEAIDALLNYLFILALIVGTILLIYAGFLLTLEHGDPKSVNRAKTIVLWVLISLIIVLLAKALSSAVKRISKS